uniref:EOG090X07E6 n=1 Tax=Daphnia hispanica TaxID=575233 RepID=A0A4Y7M5K9_9CRUS|nr:EOG090X07E6 [Daphnia hispanica]
MSEGTKQKQNKTRKVKASANADNGLFDLSVVEWTTLIYQEKRRYPPIATDTSLTTVHLKHILDLVSHTMVFYLGLEELVNVKNIERLKKDLKVCYPLIDTILDGLNPKEDLEEFCDLTDYTDVLSCPERSTFEGILNCFAESVGTVFGCLRVSSKVAAATPNWWTLDNVELLQIQLLLSNERYLVMNTEKRRSLSSLSPHTMSGDAHSHLTAVRKRDILRTFYKTIVGTMIELPGPIQTGSEESSHISKEVFMNFEYYSLHALVSDVYLILVLYPSGLHNHYLRSITRTTLKILTHEKNCKW